jgi:exodeoxyribonuclease VII large subunit
LPAGEPASDRGAWVRAAIHARLAGEPAPVASPRAAAPRVVTVAELAQQIRGSLEERFATVHVRGEISNLRQPGSGHLYFSLKDDTACIRAVLFRGQARLLKFRPENGQEVIARGRVGFYESGGDTQIVCDGLEPVGAGALALAFEQLKGRLAGEGLFDAARKRPPPFLPRRIGVVTSPTGAAIRDFLRVLHRRFPGLSVLVAPARVQGDGAADEIAAGVRRLGARGDCDVIVVTRGGGSIEDLWAFNEEVVARAIAAAPVPVVSAVGHEVDFTIADFVADVRAPTPTAAAELLAPVEAELRGALAVARTRLARATHRCVEQRRAATHRLHARLGDPRRRLAGERLRADERLRRAADSQRRLLAACRAELRDLLARLRQAHPAVQVKARRRALLELRERLRTAGSRGLDGQANALRSLRERLYRRAPHQRVLREGTRLGEIWGRLERAQLRLLDRRRGTQADLASRLQTLSPLRVLARGYALAFQASGAVLLSAAAALPGERLHLELADGALEVDVVGPAVPRKGAAGEGKGPIDPGGGGR